MTGRNTFFAIFCGLVLMGCGDDSSVISGDGDNKTGTCGNSVVEKGEICDDGNQQDGDGCSSDCMKVEDGFTCQKEGGACTKDSDPDSHPNCGNGILDSDETCDDGNNKGGDGCSADCKTIENNYKCEIPGKSCVLLTCGNGKKDPGEECDTGPLYAVEYGGGCSSDCHETHYCGDALLDDIDKEWGEECDNGANNVFESEEYNVCTIGCKRLNFCGDGKITHDEQCDDGNENDNDGCSSQCVYESGFVCQTELGKTSCIPVLCGNGKLDSNGAETCDDGNRISGDGCSAICQIEKGWACTLDANNKSVCTSSCGNYTIDNGEQCEDGNKESGDGCSSGCQVEAGYYCELSETPDAAGHYLSRCFARACGDGYVVGTEECDDGNTTDGDGCNKFCKREHNYHCPTAGQPCVLDDCGDGLVTGDETCDEGSSTPASGGCINCQIQYGWECLTPGSQCTQTAVCGDGNLQGIEECDDNNTNSGDGCSETCEIEKTYICTGIPSVCTSGECGDGFVQKGEDCDDKNFVAGDGCSPVCTKEAIFDCGTSGCKPICGDGLTLTEAGEQCDDGNLTNGDGCSSDCKIETGFTCTSFAEEAPPTLNLPITYRDFNHYTTGTGEGYISQQFYDSLPKECKDTSNGYSLYASVNHAHPDFATCATTRCENVVYKELSSDGKPVLRPSSEVTTVSGSQCRGYYSCSYLFNLWYRDSELSRTIKKTIELSKTSDDPIVYEKNDSTFYPITGQTIDGNKGEFSSEFETYFKYNGGETLTFNGDDDVWVFFNGRLGVEVAGIHGAWEKSITFDEETAARDFNMFPGGIYSLKMFHAERCTGESSFRLTLTGFVNMGKSECSSICGDGIVTGGEECDIEGHTTDETAQFGGCVNCKRVSYCGNNIIENGEGCEVNSPWCDNCQILTCGNQKLDEHEDCDHDENGQIIYRAGLEGSTQGCSFCRIIGCGDGIVDDGEDCDDGNSIDTDSCPNSCKSPTCGDGIVQQWLGEICDDTFNDGTYGHCGLGCAYMAPKCGDGVIDKFNGEVCDDGVNDGSYGTCKSDCTLAPHCGDGIVQAGFEDCDEGPQNGSGSCPSGCIITDN